MCVGGGTHTHTHTHTHAHTRTHTHAHTHAHTHPCSQTHPSTLLLFFLGWGLALVSFALFLSAFLHSRRIATVVGYVVALFGNLICLVISDGIYGGAISQNVGVGSWSPWVLLTFPCTARAHTHTHTRTHAPPPPLLQISAGSVLPAAYYAFPLFSLVRGVFLMNYRCAALVHCYGAAWDIPGSDELWRVGGEEKGGG